MQIIVIRKHNVEYQAPNTPAEALKCNPPVKNGTDILRKVASVYNGPLAEITYATRKGSVTIKKISL